MGDRGMRGATALMAAAALCASSVSAEDVTVRVLGVRSAEGRVLVAICAPADFLRRSCAHVGSAEASAGTTEVTVGDVSPGVYAVQAVHDENGNRNLDRNRMGIPTEGLGFSRDAPMRLGPPRFGDAAVEVREGGGTLDFVMRYF